MKTDGKQTTQTEPAHWIYVGLGTAEGDGTRERPFHDLAAARDAARGFSGSRGIRVLSGEHRMTPLVLDSRDSGLTIEGEGRVILSGGIDIPPQDFVALSPQEKSRLHGDAREAVIKVDLTRYGLTWKDWGEIGAVGSYFTADHYDGALFGQNWCDLIVNDARMTISRYPNEGFLFTGDNIRVGCNAQNAGSPEIWNKTRNPESDIRLIPPEAAKRAAGWKSLRDVWIYGYPKYNWADESNIPLSIDPDSGAMATKYVSKFGLREHSPFYFFNVFEETDMPGEWYLDRENGVLYLYPPRDIGTCTVSLSLNESCLISIENADSVTLRGLTLQNNRGDALCATGDHLLIDYCEIRNIGADGAVIDGSHCTVQNCRIHDTGRTGITINGGDRNTLTSSENLIAHNDIHHNGMIYRTYHPAILMNGVGCHVISNRLHDSSHQLILFKGNDHLIEYNELYNACRYADDSSAIYSGRDYSCQGHIIRYNYFHDIDSVSELDNGVFGVYADDNSAGIRYYGNVFLRVQNAVLLHGGHDLEFSGNLIVSRTAGSKDSMRISRYWYPQSLKAGGAHPVRLASVPWQSEIWQKRYPRISEYLSWDPDREQLYPHYCRMQHNAVFNHLPLSVNFPYDKPEYRNEISDNHFYEVEDREYTFADLSALMAQAAAEDPGFVNLPLEHMCLTEGGDAASTTL